MLLSLFFRWVVDIGFARHKASAGKIWVCFGFEGGFWYEKWLCFGFELGLIGFVRHKARRVNFL